MKPAYALYEFQKVTLHGTTTQNVIASEAKQSRKSLSQKKLHEIATSLSLLAMTEGINGYFLKSVLLPFFLLLPCLFVYGQERIESADVTVVFPPRLRIQADVALGLYRQAAERVRRATGLPDPGQVTIELVDSEVAYQAAYRRLGGAGAPEHALAVAFSPKNVILVRSSHLAALGSGSLPEILTHETFHLYLASMLRRVNGRVPLWFNEGVAQWVAGQKIKPRLRDMLRIDAKSGRLPSLGSLSERFPDEGIAISLAYGQSLSFIEWFEERRPGSVRAILSALAKGERFDAALLDTAGGRLSELEVAHRVRLASEHSFLKSFFSQLTLFSVLSIIALAAFVRYLVKRRRLRKKLEEEESGMWNTE